MLITDAKDVGLIIKNLHAVNQVMKNMVHSSEWVTSGNMIYGLNPKMSSETSIDVGFHMGVLKIDLYELSNYNMYIHGKQFFAFHKEFKKYITGIEINDSEIRILTTSQSIYFSIPLYDDISHLIKDEIRWLDRYIDNGEISPVYTLDTMNQYELDLLLESGSTTPFTFNFGGHKIRMVKRLLRGATATSKIQIQIYDVDEIPNGFLIEFTFNRKEMVLKHYYMCINF